MKKYIGTKVVNATPAWRVDGKVYLKDDAVPKSMNREDGYKVVYEGGYESWSPKDVFEKAYREVGSVNFGGGNHFIELDANEEGEKFLVIHTGSRNLGVRYATITKTLLTRIATRRLPISRRLLPS